MTSFVLADLISVLGIFIFYDVKYDDIEVRYEAVNPLIVAIGWSFLGAFILLAATYIQLTLVISEYTKLNTLQSFRTEKRTLLTLLAIFSVSYMLRFLWIVIAIPLLVENYSEFKSMMIQNVLYIIWDVLPMTLIMYYHFINFRDTTEQTSRTSFTR